jgi:glycine cleavage system H protein
MVDDLTDFRFTHTDEWVRHEGDRLRVGITDFAQSKLGDVVHVDLPEPDDHRFESEEEVGAVESLSGSMEFHAPVAGRITAINTNLLSAPETVSADPYGEGWLIEIQPDDPAELEELMDVNEYESGLPEDEEE